MANRFQTSNETFSRADPSSFLGEPRQDEDVEMTMDDRNERIILAVDFGTTFSSVAHVRLDGMTQDTLLDLEKVKCITRYPGDRSGARDGWPPREDVPTELWYSLKATESLTKRLSRERKSRETPAPFSGASKSNYSCRGQIRRRTE